MAFLRELDYLTLINQDNLNVVLKQARGILGDPDVLLNTEQGCIATMKNFLRGRFKVDQIFADFQTWNIATTYQINQRLDWTADDWTAATVYTSGQLVNYSGSVYEKNATTAGYVAGTLPTSATYFTNRGLEDVYYVTTPPAYDEDTEYTATTGTTTYLFKYYIRTSVTAGYEAGILPTDTTYWERITDLSPYAATGHWPNETSYWTRGDNRDLSIVECLVDLVLYDLHAIINPRQIPALRDSRGAAAEKWLREIKDGSYDMALPEYGAQTGYRIRFGSNEQNQLTY
jgi:hypothetical protein